MLPVFRSEAEILLTWVQPEKREGPISVSPTTPPYLTKFHPLKQRWPQHSTCALKTSPQGALTEWSLHLCDEVALLIHHLHSNHYGCIVGRAREKEERRAGLVPQKEQKTLN